MDPVMHNNPFLPVYRLGNDSLNVI